MTTVPLQGEFATIPVSSIAVAPQIRTRNGFDEASIKELSHSIQQHGLMQPIMVRRTDNSTFEVIAGHRRLLACQRIGMQEVPVTIRPTTEVNEAMAAQAVENLQRMDLALMDKAEGVAQMVQRMGAKRTAQALSKSAAWVSKHTSLTKLPEPVRLLAEEGYTADVEILLLLRKLWKLDKPGVVFLPLIAKIRAGQASRQTVIDALARLTDGPDVTIIEEDFGDGTGEDSAQPKLEIGDKVKYGKLELDKDTAAVLLDALTYAKKHKPSSRPTDMQIEYVQEFIRKTWGDQ